MHIERLQVEAEGFLRGLDISFNAGLNVVIGARGTGKTSIVELIRFCLDAPSFTETAATQGRQQAIAILEGGAVTLTVRDGESSYLITRAASGHLTSSAPLGTLSCTVLAQNEIESVGAQASGRLRLIDRYWPDRDKVENKKTLLRAQLKSLTAEISALLQEGQSLAAEIESFGPIQAQLAAAREGQRKILKTSKASAEQQDQLRKFQSAGQAVAARESVLEQDAIQVSELDLALASLEDRAAHVLLPWPNDARTNLLEAHAADVLEVVDHLAKARLVLLRIDQGVTGASRKTQEVRVTIDEQSRQLRQVLEVAQEGVGAATKLVTELEERQGRLNALQSRFEERRTQYKAVISGRDSVYEQLEDLRDESFFARSRIGAALNAALAPSVRVRVTRSESTEDYRAAIVAGLRGSGIHYNTLAPQLAREVAPNELVRWIENLDASALGAAIGITSDRSSLVINALRVNGTADLIGSIVEDGVGLDLLDGRDFKASDRLSIGQRCTVVLPVLLGHHGDPLVLDQPEDHLDNAFIASTLVAALKRRTPSDQFIFTSHNANIPVLGNADRVIVMDSDGDRGFAMYQGRLDDRDIVESVTNIMEGGSEAFAERARFYDDESEAAE